MIDTIFYFIENLSFEDYRSQVMNNEIAGRTIVFAAKQKAIYKGGEQYGSISEEDIKAILNKLLKDPDINTGLTEADVEAIVRRLLKDIDLTNIIDKDELIDIINNLLKDGDLNEFITEDQIIDILNRIDLPVATENKVGGIKIGYPTNNNSRLYGVMLDESNKAYVRVPWITGEGGSGSGTPGNYYQQAFKATDTKDKPSVPNSNFPNGNDGWREYAENNDGTKYVWMCTRLVDYTGAPLGEWNGPWMISGSIGQSQFKSFVFKRSTGTPSTPTGGTYENPIPAGWSDGIPAETSDKQPTWMSSRTFTSDGKDPQDKVWSTPQKVTDTSDIDFKFSSVETNPGNPKDNPTNWHDDATEDDIWMAVSKLSGGVWGKWEIFKIKGEQGDPGNPGKPGADGKDIEFVYTRTNTDDERAIPDPNANSENGLPVNGKVFQDDDFVPDGWYDNPKGIEETMRYEWVAIRTKQDDTWSNFRGPILWSHWGVNGMDGDGVEYIYYAGPKLPIDPVNDPTIWWNHETWKEEYQEDEYTGPELSNWKDDPIDLEHSDYGPGTKEWVSVRKQEEDKNGEKKWGQFSVPALWAYYSKNGKDGVVDGYQIDITNSNMPVPTDATGHVSSYNNKCKVNVFHNGIPETDFELNVESTKRSDGKETTGINAVVNDEEKCIDVTISNVDEFTDVSTYITVNVTPKDAPSRQFLITAFGVEMGGTASSVDLYTSSDVIRTNYEKTTVVPQSLKVGVKINNGGEQEEIKYVTEATDFEFSYYYDDNAMQEAIMRADNITLSKNRNTVTIRMKMRKTNKIVDSKQISYVQDGPPGIGISPVMYNINVLSNSMEHTDLTYRFSGSIKFKVVKQIGTERTEMKTTPWTGSNNEYLVVNVGGTQVTIGKQETNNNFTVTYPDGGDHDYFEVSTNSQIYNYVDFSTIELKSATNETLASTTVPFIIKGAQGERGEQGNPGDGTVQSISGVVMRFIDYRDIQSNFYTHWFCVGDYDRNNNDGIKYLDVLLYTDGGYYQKKTPGTAEQPPIAGNFDTGQWGSESSDPNKEWIVFSPTSNAAFQALIAKYGYIENLTSNEVIIVDNGIPVAGMTSGTAVTDEDHPLYGVNKGSVRIWAGNANASENLQERPFVVTNIGYLKATYAYIKGTIEADSGYFKGELKAATGTFTGDLKGAGGTFTGDISAANGDFKGTIHSDYVVAKDGKFFGEIYAKGGTFSGNIDATGCTIENGNIAHITGDDITVTNANITGKIYATEGEFNGVVKASQFARQFIAKNVKEWFIDVCNDGKKPSYTMTAEEFVEEFATKVKFSSVSSPGDPSGNSANWHNKKQSGDIWMAVRRLTDNGTWSTWTVTDIRNKDVEYDSIVAFPSIIYLCCFKRGDIGRYTQQDAPKLIINIPNPEDYIGQSITLYVERDIKFLDLSDNSIYSPKMYIQCNGDHTSQHFILVENINAPDGGGNAVELQTNTIQGYLTSYATLAGDTERYAKIEMCAIKTPRNYSKWLILNSSNISLSGTITSATTTSGNLLQ